MKKNISLIYILISACSIIFLFSYDTTKEVLEYTDTFNYLDSSIYLKIYTTSSEKAEEIFLNIEEIYNDYDLLVDKNKAYDGINNLYYINYNLTNNEYIKLDKKLYKLIKYGKSLYELTDGLIDISKGSVIDVWSSYQYTAYGVPTIEELNLINVFDIDDIVLSNNKIKNNNVNIDLSAISKSYVTSLVIDYLKDNNINQYVINAGENISVGDNFGDDYYTIGIGNPDNAGDIIEVVNGNNIDVVTIGSYNEYYYFNNTRYNYQINPKTLYPSEYFKSVTVISSDINKSNYIANALFLMDIDSGMEYIKKKNVEVLWYTTDNKIITSDNFDKYLET